MTNAAGFVKRLLRVDDLPDTFSKDQVLELVEQALQASADARSDLDETRISFLKKTLLDIENTSKDQLTVLAARCARINDDED